jgi:hypothetical protein
MVAREGGAGGAQWRGALDAAVAAVCGGGGVGGPEAHPPSGGAGAPAPSHLPCIGARSRTPLRRGMPVRGGGLASQAGSGCSSERRSRWSPVAGWSLWHEAQGGVRARAGGGHGCGKGAAPAARVWVRTACRHRLRRCLPSGERGIPARCEGAALTPACRTL